MGTAGENVAGEVPVEEPDAVTDEVTVHDEDGELERTNGLVAVRGAAGIGRLARVVAGVFGDTYAPVTLYHVADEDGTDEDVETLLDGLANRLAELGMAASAVETRIERDQGPLEAIVAADAYDAVVMGETDPSLATFVFGMPADQVAERFLGPVLVLQREPSSGSSSDFATDDPDR